MAAKLTTPDQQDAPQTHLIVDAFRCPGLEGLLGPPDRRVRVRWLLHEEETTEPSARMAGCAR
ncbi:MAG TPA: hypothetical protein VH307_29350, partial [Streptosporangiaceae bacterium]|nr:hypothetical protein [Streptosporangiaceae bacterium]